MKKLLAFYAGLMLVSFPGILSSTYGQWQKYVIDDNMKTAVSVDTADLNGDNKLDLVVTEFSNNSLYWYENNYPSWIKHTIDGNANGVTFAYCGDVDGDDTIDVVANLYGWKQMVWYENNHPTWTKHFIDLNTGNADFMQVEDINGDGTPDVLTAGGIEGGNVAWYENNYPLWTKHIIDSVISGTVAVCRVTDIDGDGIQDVVATLVVEHEVVWYKTENKGITWTKQIIDDNLINAFGLNSGDIDGDGDLDIAVTTGGPYFNGKDVIWYENQLPTWNKHVVDTDLSGATQPYVTDVDGDSTMDIIATGFNVDDVVWYKNNHPTWIKHIIDDNLDGPRTGIIADMNGDKVNDIIMPGTSNVVLYMQELVNTTDFLAPVARIYPNPTNDMLTIETDYIDQHSIEITSLNGQLIHSDKMHGTMHQIDLSSFQKGVYFITIRTKDFVTTKKIIKL